MVRVPHREKSPRCIGLRCWWRRTADGSTRAWVPVKRRSAQMAAGRANALPLWSGQACAPRMKYSGAIWSIIHHNSYADLGRAFSSLSATVIQPLCSPRPRTSQFEKRHSERGGSTWGKGGGGAKQSHS